MVAVHSRVWHAPDDRGAALVHLFRFEGDRIAELWDIGQRVPTESPNANGMFCADAKRGTHGASRAPSPRQMFESKFPQALQRVKRLAEAA